MFSSEIMHNLNIGLEVTLYGLGGVFSVLLIFYLLVKLMVKLGGKFPGKNDDNN